MGATWSEGPIEATKCPSTWNATWSTCRSGSSGSPALVEEAIYKAVQALRERDRRLAREVIDGDEAIDRDENDIAEECLKLLALHQPVAGDLRRIATDPDDHHRPGADGRPRQDIAEAGPGPGRRRRAHPAPAAAQMTDLTT